MNTDSVPVVDVFVRHSAGCPKAGDRHCRRCRCPKWLTWREGAKTIRQSAKTRSWERAIERARKIEDKYTQAAKGDTTAMEDDITVEQAISRFLDDKRIQHAGPALMNKLTLLLEVRLVEFSDKGLAPGYMKDFGLDHLEAFRKTWPGGALTRKKTQEQLRSFFKYCHLHGWTRTNPAALLSRIKADTVPTDYFNRDEMDKILKACGTYRAISKQLAPRREKVKALVLLMRWSGLRIGDAIKLERSRLQGNKLLLRTEKTGTPVYCPLPPKVAQIIGKVANSNPKYIFWTGNGTPKTAYEDWRRTFKAVFKQAKIGKRCHVHMFRDTFAVEMLLAGVPREQVSMLLGHRSIKTTEKHYSPWVRARQTQLEESVMKAWQMAAKKKGRALGPANHATFSLP